jgi:hypothetical protein
MNHMRDDHFERNREAAARFERELAERLGKPRCRFCGERVGRVNPAGWCDGCAEWLEQG